MKVFYVSTIFRSNAIAKRFLKFFSNEFPKDTAELYLYCHDRETFKVAKRYARQNIFIIKGKESVFYTEAINISINLILKKNQLGNICIFDSDCFAKKNFHKICLRNRNRAIIFRNRDFNTNELLPAGFLIKNNLIGSSLDIEERICDKKKKYHKIDFSNGRGLTFPVEFPKNNGLLNHIDFPLYASDNEYSWKLSRKIGLYYCTSSEILSSKEETNFNPAVLKFSFQKKLGALFSIRSNINIFVRYKYINSVCPKKFLKPLWIFRGLLSALLVAILPFSVMKKLSKFK